MLLSNASDLINGLGFSVVAMLNGFAEDERDRIFSSFGILLVDFADCVSNIPVEHDGDDLAVETVLPRCYPRSLHA